MSQNYVQNQIGWLVYEIEMTLIVFLLLCTMRRVKL